MSPQRDAFARRVYAGGICTETNVFSPLSTTLEDFELVDADAPQSMRDRAYGSSFREYAARAASRGWRYSQGTFAYATPAGPTSTAAYETLRTRLLDEIAETSPDAVVLTLHGAMVATCCSDCEDDIVAAVRSAVGERVTIGVLLDPHCDLSDYLVATSDVIVIYREYPHTDMDACARELIDLVLDAAEGRTTPVMAAADCRMIGIYPTLDEPMRGFVDRRLHAGRNSHGGVLSASLAHGFPWGDSDAMDARALVVADDDVEAARREASAIAEEFFELRHQVPLTALDYIEAIDAALQSDERPIVLADISDNAGGGAASDSTFVARELLRRGVRDAAVALIWDPLAVSAATAAGEGSTLTMQIGGKVGPASGEPLELEVTVRGVTRELVQHWPQGDDGVVEVPSGASVWVEADGVDLILSAARRQVLALDVFTAFGIDPSARRILVVKSMGHYRASFDAIAARTIPMSSPGTLDLDPRRIPYTKLDKRKFPWVDDPWDAAPSTCA